MYEAANEALEKQGLSREMTAERRFGNHIKSHEQATESYYHQSYVQTLAEKLEQHVKNDPKVFVNESPKQIKRVLKQFGGKITLLKSYPEVTKAIYAKLGEPIPEELEPVFEE